jgi:membrane protein implicated in regulation of membrane protease activity
MQLGYFKGLCMYSWVWLAVGVVLVILELLTPTGFFLLILGGSAIVVGLLAAVGVCTTWIPQAGFFCVIAVVSWLTLGQKLRRRLALKPPQQGQIVGSIVRVTQRIAPGETGAGELWGTSWRIRNADAAELLEGSEVVVVGSEGITLHVKQR